LTRANTAGASDVAAGSPDKVGFRSRLLEALNESVSTTSYTNTTVADIVRIARTSRRTFYEYFPDREACFVALLTEYNDDLIRAINVAADANAPWETQVRQAIRGWIEAAEKRPGLMLAWIRDAPALGAEAARLHREFMKAFIEMLQGLCVTAGIGPVRRQRAIMLLGGLNELLRVTLQEGGRCEDITDEAVDVCVALLTPRS
jgi:AcrR family transcriptional regulator